MKKSIIFIFGILYCTSSFGQQRIDVTDFVKIDLPNQTQKITKEEATSFAANQFNNDKIVLASIAKKKEENLYKVDHILISLSSDNKSVNENHLSQMKKGLDELFEKNKTYSSNIKINSNNKILVIKYVMGNVEYFHFYCYNTTNSKALTGVFEFSSTDEKEAFSLMDSLNKSILFKE